MLTLSLVVLVFITLVLTYCIISSSLFSLSLTSPNLGVSRSNLQSYLKW